MFSVLLFRHLLDFRCRRRYDRIDSIKRKPVEPADYCAKWIPILTGKSPGDWGYKAACIRELMGITGFAESTIKSWGSNYEDTPDYVKRMLRQQDIINQVQRLTQRLPDDFPQE